MNIEELGFTQEELQRRIVDQCCEQVLRGKCYDEDGDPCTSPSSIYIAMEATIKNRIDLAVKQIADDHILPRLRDGIETLCISETNSYGEKKADPVAFVEYIVKRAEKYLLDGVDYCGRTKSDPASDYNWKSEGTRVTYLIHRHLGTQIEEAMKVAVGNANETIAEGLAEATKASLEKIASRLKVTIDTGR